ncbi:MAG: hypothetical protein Q7S37_03215 [bacterium]|nr:hypothetical protein [bacterium]
MDPQTTSAEEEKPIEAPTSEPTSFPKEVKAESTSPIQPQATSGAIVSDIAKPTEPAPTGTTPEPNTTNTEQAVPASTAPTGTAPATSTDIPAEIKGWNWGAFFLNWIWAIGNQTWIGLLAFVLGPIMMVILGLKGNEWAWQNRKFESVEQFKAVQKAWAKWGLIIFILNILLTIGIIAAMVVIAARTTPVNTTFPDINLK